MLRHACEKGWVAVLQETGALPQGAHMIHMMSECAATVTTKPAAELGISWSPAICSDQFMRAHTRMKVLAFWDNV